MTRQDMISNAVCAFLSNSSVNPLAMFKDPEIVAKKIVELVDCCIAEAKKKETPK